MTRPVLAIVAIGFCVLAGALLVYDSTRSEREVSSPSPAASAPAPVPAPRREALPVAAEPPAASRAPTAIVKPAPAPPPAPEPTPPRLGILNIDSDVRGAQVFIDRQFVGAAPVTGASVAPGTHRINVSAEGYEGVAETVDVSPGPRDVLIKLREVRLEARLDVVHKHRFGSCTGHLTATPRGVRYETADKDDAFVAPLSDLDEFAVDYLEKNLRLKVRNGKTFNFTDPEGNADRLFVFHRDVEKARERLKRGDPPASW